MRSTHTGDAEGIPAAGNKIELSDIDFLPSGPVHESFSLPWQRSTDSVIRNTLFFIVYFFYFVRFLREYEDRFEKEHGYFRPVIQDVVEKYLDCGNSMCGFARIRCPDCGEERLLMFSCKTRGFCPSCLYPLFQYFFVIVVHLLFNLFLILWLRYSFFPYHRHSISGIRERGVLEGFFAKHSISKREKEIAELILQGKSNRDIEHQLFISPHTVKNHICSLYQKSGVKSRSQLIHLILKSNNIS